MSAPDAVRPPLMSTVLQLTGPTEALAAIGALLRIRREALTPAPAVAAGLEGVARALGIDVERIDEPTTLTALGAIRAFFRQALDLLEEPTRRPGWTYTDPIILEAQGHGSMGIADAIAGAAPRLGHLAARLNAPGARFLDVGCGVGWLAIAMARRFPNLGVVGLDVWWPALDRAAQNVEGAGLASQVELRDVDVATLDDEALYDAVWFPGPFIPRASCEKALPRLVRALRPGGWLFFGLYGGPPDPLAQRLADLRAVRSGGHAWTPAEVASFLTQHGLVDAHDAQHGTAAPVILIAARAPEPSESPAKET